MCRAFSPLHFEGCLNPALTGWAGMCRGFAPARSAGMCRSFAPFGVAWGAEPVGSWSGLRQWGAGVSPGAVFAGFRQLRNLAGFGDVWWGGCIGGFAPGRCLGMDVGALVGASPLGGGDGWRCVGFGWASRLGAGELSVIDSAVVKNRAGLSHFAFLERKKLIGSRSCRVQQPPRKILY